MKEFVEELIARLKERENHYRCEVEKVKRFSKIKFCRELQMRAYETSIKIVNELAEEYNNEWIPCSKNTPDNRDAVLVCATGKDEGVFISYYIEEEDRWRYDTDDGGHYYVDVIAWQPLPQPYKEGSE